MSFNFNPIGGLTDSSAFPSNPTTEQAAREQIQRPLNQLRDYLNSIDFEGFKANGGTISGPLIINALLRATDIQINGNNVYHTGRKPTAADVGASPSSHNHDSSYSSSSHNHDSNYLKLTGGTITGNLNFGSFTDGSTGNTTIGNGYVIQWGNISSTFVNRFVNVDITFPKLYSTQPKVFVSCDWLSGSTSTANVQVNPYSVLVNKFTATFKVDDTMFQSSSFSGFWISIGKI